MPDAQPKPTRELTLGELTRDLHDATSLVLFASSSASALKHLTGLIAETAVRIDAWAEHACVTGATADDVRDVVGLGAGVCARCSTPLPDWADYQSDDDGLQHCPPCASADQHDHPKHWRNLAEDERAEAHA